MCQQNNTITTSNTSGYCTSNTSSNYYNTATTTASTSYSISLKDWGLQLNSTNSERIPKITNIKILNPFKVVGFTFDEKTKIKTICDDRDDFSLEYACFLAYAKLLFSKTLTHEGIIVKSQELQYEKKYIKLVKEAIRNYKKEELEKAKELDREEEKKQIKIRQQKKKAEKKKRSQEAEIKNIANILKETLNK